MKLECIREAIAEDGSKIMEYTKGKIYEATESYDPPGWKVFDDNGKKEVFFDPFYLFKEVE